MFFQKLMTKPVGTKDSYDRCCFLIEMGQDNTDEFSLAFDRSTTHPFVYFMDEKMDCFPL